MDGNSRVDEKATLLYLRIVDQKGFTKTVRVHFKSRAELTMEGKVLPLSETRPGDVVRLVRLNGGRRMCARLAHMGLYPGVQVTIVSGGEGAPVIIRKGQSTISIGKGMSGKILVEKVSTSRDSL